MMYEMKKASTAEIKQYLRTLKEMLYTEGNTEVTKVMLCSEIEKCYTLLQQRMQGENETDEQC